MKLLISKILIVCIFAISFHGIATDEYSLLTLDQKAEQQTTIQDSTNPVGKTLPSAQASCDICQVVHQYVLANKLTISGPEIEGAPAIHTIQVPPDQSGKDILHPPNI
ncbi:MAG: hypothetical protein COA47_01810 [Robiginitomaculum sp.]|nr:MAG: hypothetical protein COA47_01810 [Robiginitomaculum sp.]